MTIDKHRRALTLLVSAWFSCGVGAQDVTGVASDDPASLGEEQIVPEMPPADAGAGVIESLDSELDMLFADFDIVVTAGRKKQSSNLTGVPVSVLVAEDIHNSGSPNVPLLLEFIPGMQVLQVDRNRYAVGVRGLHHEFSDRTLMLLDGRNAGSGVFGGVDFQRLPLLVEDLERIEVVRGPGGGVWGANAFNGVMNFITKDPRDTQGVFLSTQMNEFGDVYSHARWGASRGNLSWRLSMGFEDQESSEDAISNDGFDSRDFARVRRFNGDAVYAPDDDTVLKFGVGHAHVERGDHAFFGLQTFDDERLDYTRVYGTLEKTLDAGHRLKLDLFTTLEDVNRPVLWRYSVMDTEMNASVELDLEGDHRLSFGATGRVVRIDSSPARTDTLLRDETFHEQWAGAYIADTWTLTDRLTIEAQVRTDWYSETTLDWSGRLAGLYALDDEGRHMLRAAVAKAFRAPQTSLREIETGRVPLSSPPFPPDTFGSVLVRADNLDNEQVYSLEAGYHGKPRDGMTVRLDGYYQFLQDVTGVRLLPDPMMVGRTIAELDNLGDAQAWGVEAELAFEGDPGRVGLWYNYHDLRYTYNDDLRGSRSFAPAEHSVGMRALAHLGEGARIAANYRYTSDTPGDETGTLRVAEMHRLDLSLLVDVFDGKGELAIGLRDVFDDTDRAVAPVGSSGTAFETPGRTLWVRVQAKF